MLYCFLVPLGQVTTNLVAENNKNLVSDISGGQESEMSHCAKIQVSIRLFLWRLNGRIHFVAFSSSRNALSPWLKTLFLPLRSQQHQAKFFSAYHLFDSSFSASLFHV